MAPRGGGGGQRSKRPARKKKTPSAEYIDLLSDDNDAIPHKPQPERTSRRLASLNRKPTDKLVIYPPVAEAKGRITVTQADYLRLRLANGRYGSEQLLLNDTLVDFYVRYLIEEKLTREQLQRVHIFNSFFMKRLRKSQAEGSDGTRALLKWVQDTDLLSKDFLFFPVHEKRLGGHWSLAVICFPGLVLPNKSEALTMSAQTTLPPPPPTSAPTSADAAALGLPPSEESTLHSADASFVLPPAVAASSNEAASVAVDRVAVDRDRSNVTASRSTLLESLPPLLQLDPKQCDIVDPHTQPAHSETCGIPPVLLEALLSPAPLNSATLQPPLQPPVKDRAFLPRPVEAGLGTCAVAEGCTAHVAVDSGRGALDSSGVSVNVVGLHAAGIVAGGSGTDDGAPAMEVEQAAEPIDDSLQTPIEAAAEESRDAQSAADSAATEADKAPRLAAPCILFFDSSLIPGASLKKKQIFGDLRDLLELFLNDRCKRSEEQAKRPPAETVGQPPKRGEALRGLPPPWPANRGPNKGIGAPGKNTEGTSNGRPACKRRRGEPMEAPGKHVAEARPMDDEAVVDVCAPGDDGVSEGGAGVEFEACPNAAGPAGASSSRRPRGRCCAPPGRSSTRSGRVKLTSQGSLELSVVKAARDLAPAPCLPPSSWHAADFETHAEDGLSTDLADDPDDVVDEVDVPAAAAAESARCHCRIESHSSVASGPSPAPANLVAGESSPACALRSSKRAESVGPPAARAAVPPPAGGSGAQEQQPQAAKATGGRRRAPADASGHGPTRLPADGQEHAPRRAVMVSGSRAVAVDSPPRRGLRSGGHDAGGRGACPASSAPLERGDPSARQTSLRSGSDDSSFKAEAEGRSSRRRSRPVEDSAERRPAPRGTSRAAGHATSSASATPVDCQSERPSSGLIEVGERLRVSTSAATAAPAPAAPHACAEASQLPPSAIARSADPWPPGASASAPGSLETPPDHIDDGMRSSLTKSAEQAVGVALEADCLPSELAPAVAAQAPLSDHPEHGVEADLRGGEGEGAGMSGHLEAVPSPAEVGGEDGDANAAGDDLDDAGSADPQDSRKRTAGPESPRWFTNASMPAIICRRAPQQDNSFDCGLYMLQFIEILATQQPPSFESEVGIEEYFGKHLFDADRITLKREQIRALIDKLSESNA